jgi:hypothetical protein
MIYLISKDKKQYKANLHCHSILSDGKKTPEELKEMYKSHGYSILAITDHERPMAHNDLTDEGFIMLTGYENYIRPNSTGTYDVYQKEIHLNLFARESENVKMICFNDCYARYLKRDNAVEGLVRVGSERPREFTREYINEYIRTARENGYIVAYNHPYWSMDDESAILSYEGFFSMEICNYGSYVMNGIEHCAPLYDKMLSSGMHIACHAADDNHNTEPLESPNSDSFGAFTMIMPESFTYSGIIDAMEKGDMYASMGPEIFELSVDGDTVNVKCSGVAHIFVYVGSKGPRFLHSSDGADSLTEASFKIDERARYIRVAILDSHGKWANTRGYFPKEFGR